MRKQLLTGLAVLALSASVAFAAPTQRTNNFNYNQPQSGQNQHWQQSSPDRSVVQDQRGNGGTWQNTQPSQRAVYRQGSQNGRYAQANGRYSAARKQDHHQAQQSRYQQARYVARLHTGRNRYAKQDQRQSSYSTYRR